MGFIAFSPSNYWVLLVFIGFFPFLEWVFGYFWFLPFWAIFNVALFITRFCGVFWCFIGFYWVFSLFWMSLGLFKKTIYGGGGLGRFCLVGVFWPSLIFTAWKSNSKQHFGPPSQIFGVSEGKTIQFVQKIEKEWCPQIWISSFSSVASKCL